MVAKAVAAHSACVAHRCMDLFKSLFLQDKDEVREPHRARGSVGSWAPPPLQVNAQTMGNITARLSFRMEDVAKDVYTAFGGGFGDWLQDRGVLAQELEENGPGGG